MGNLKELLGLQKKLDNKVRLFSEKPITTLALAKALIHEVIELEDEFNWKWWEKAKFVDYNKVEGELIDIFFFFLSICNNLNLNEERLIKLYKKKYKINLKRLSDGGR